MDLSAFKYRFDCYKLLFIIKKARVVKTSSLYADIICHTTISHVFRDTVFSLLRIEREVCIETFFKTKKLEHP